MHCSHAEYSSLFGRRRQLKKKEQPTHAMEGRHDQDALASERMRGVHDTLLAECLHGPRLSVLAALVLWRRAYKHLVMPPPRCLDVSCMYLIRIDH